MRVLAVGGGAREHAIVHALARSGADVFVCMKNSNPGIARLAKGVALLDETDVPKVVEFAKAKDVSLAVVGPEAPLQAGLADGLGDAGIPTASPRKAAARIETSKSFMRNLMRKHGVRGSVRFVEADTVDDVGRALDELGTDIVVKPVGLTGGKGVKVFGEHMMTREDVFAYAEEIASQRIGGGTSMVVEEKLVGEEFTLQAFCDGSRVVPMPAVQDHKRAYEGDKGPNTGGMGSYSQNDGLLPFLTKNDYADAVSIMTDTVRALRTEGAEYRGPLYGQFMLTKHGPKVIEFNARFGDPEAMNVLSLLRSDFTAICESMAGGDLSGRAVEFEKKASVCKYVVPQGYGSKPLSGEEIKVDEKAIEAAGAVLYYANVNEKDGRIYTTTSRSVGIVGVADRLEDAERMAEEGVRHVIGKVFVRHDIGRKDVLDAKVARMNRIRGLDS
jgi:phosphoribosylamine--glycine ligase